MAKKRIKNKERELTELNKKRSLLIDSSIDQGFSDKQSIAKVTGLSYNDVSNTLNVNPELMAKYKVMRKYVVEKAADNIQRIIEDENHSKNYDASKFMIQNYKSELDDILKSKDSEELNLSIGGDEEDTSPIVIRFGKPKKD